MHRLALAALILAATPALAVTPAMPEDEIFAARYGCEGDTPLEAVFINTASGNSFAVVALEGRAIPMAVAMSASGARYLSEPDVDGVQYELWTKGNEATLSTIKDGVDAPLLAGCASAE